ncbi:encapsulin [Levilactobacillus brevis]|uniref:encapsulin n=1 Tax=Levilactobacillus brevis TaxID=1580 RepID=UPI0012F4A39B|nr:encapsulin [Levilactobacillus brevis]
MVDEDVKRAYQPIYTIAAGIHFTYQEVFAAQMAGQPLQTDKAETVRRAISEKENDIIFNGESKVGITGLTNLEGIQAMNADKKFSESTGAEMQETLRKAKSLITVIPGFNQARLKLVLAPAQYESLNSRYSDYDSGLFWKSSSAGWFNSIETTSALVGKGLDNSECAMIFDSTSQPVASCSLVMSRSSTRSALS